MSNNVFPTLAGLQWNYKIKPSFNTKVQRAVSGRELRAAFQAYPLWQLELGYEFLFDQNLGTDFDTLTGFFLARKGQFDSFLITVGTDSTVTAMQFGIGNGTTAAFQLTRDFGANGNVFTEPVMNLNGTPSIYVNGVLTTPSLISATGVVTFSAPPAAAAVLTWTGAYYWRVRFLQDIAEFDLFMANVFQLQKLEMVGAVGNRV
jgi:uncharacterized protein (TIGR02217 family)